jgi:class 3 adenylate cyclase/tetratricopeptide (TPR) repeat protein
MVCPECGTENEPHRKFCGECGSPLARPCPACGTPNGPTAKFCGECGSALNPGARGSALASPTASPEPSAERRLVSVLFADLVGFTALSESRDPEEVRDLLSRYFDISRQLIGRYGGTVEKFIGDAVMAVWGTPVAREDDPERAVRAALDLTASVAALGQDVNAPGLRARAGVLTGEVAVTIGAEGQGMVAGDLVNTASRIQSIAPPGGVLVGDVTRRAAEAAIAYEDAGTHELKGKTEPIHLWRAVRVTAGRGGALKAAGLEAPFVGREREMRLVKELFHASADERKAHVVSVVGIAGVGKSRLSLEFEKYVDGLAQDVRWHRGRCLAYGEGVAYWALVEMVRMRAQIAEGEDAASSLQKLRASIAEFVPDPEERSWIEPRLAHLIGLEDRSARDQADLFSAWRLFFERIAERDPIAMVFEDLQWADNALMDFIEYLLEWSKDHPVFILTLARPEISERRPTWGAGKRNFTSLYLEPLSSEAMKELLGGLVPGVAEELRSRILDRAEGVPLYAVETVRMLLDRGLLTKDGAEYRLTGQVGDLEIPETLHALIASRLDGLAPDERKVLQSATVMGKTFFKDGLAAVAGVGADLDALLSSLVRKEVLHVQADPRSPERGQFGFLQDLVKRVAYETLSKRERKAKHLAVAAYLQAGSTYEEGEIVEVIASHYLQAFQAAPDADDAPQIKARAGELLTAAGEHAAALAANEEGQSYFEQAAALSDDPSEKARMFERAGQMAQIANKSDSATQCYEQAIRLFEDAGQTHPAARVSARLGEVVWQAGHIDKAVERMERSFEVLSLDDPDEDLAWLSAQLGRFLYFMGEPERAGEWLERALDMAEGLWLPEVLSQALNSKGTLVLLGAKGRPEEGFALLRHALHLGLEHDLPGAALRAYYNLSNLLYYYDRYDESLSIVNEGLTMARKLGYRNWEWPFLAELTFINFMKGSWNEALERMEEVPYREDFSSARFAIVEVLQAIPALHLHRGHLDAARETIEPFEVFADSADLQERASYAAAHAMVLRAEGRLEESLAETEKALGVRFALGPIYPGVKMGLAEAAESALSLGDLDKVRGLISIIDTLPAGQTTPFQKAQRDRFGARLAALEGDTDAVEPAYVAAIALYREIGTPFWLAQSLLEHAESLIEQGRTEDAGPLLEEARSIFVRLEAQPWVERTAKASSLAITT